MVCTILPTVAAHAATYYVATTGNNGNPGTEEQPWRTVAYAVGTMAAGDTTYVRGGTYTESVIRFKRSGTANAPIKLLNYPGEKPVIDFVDPAVGKTVTILHSSGQNVAMGYITVEDSRSKTATMGSNSTACTTPSSDEIGFTIISTKEFSASVAIIISLIETSLIIMAILLDAPTET